MKKQFLHEQHNLQDKATKPGYQDRFADEGDRYDRGGISERELVRFRGKAIIFDLRQFLLEDKQSLLQTLQRHLKFIVGGEVGTISQLMRNPKLAEHIKTCHEMTRRSVLRSMECVGEAKHPKKDRYFQVVGFTCFLQPFEPFSDPMFKETFAFRMNVAKPRS